MTNLQTIWLVALALSFLSPRLRPSYRVMAAAGLLALAFPGTMFGHLAFLVSVIAATVDLAVFAVFAVAAVKGKA